MTTVIQKSRSFDQYQLKKACDILCDRIDELLEYFNLDKQLKYNGKMLVGCCPIHNGDNTTAFNLYPTGDTYRGNWKCRTHQCEKIFKGSIIGFIRGFLSSKNGWVKPGDKSVSFDETLKFIQKFIDAEISEIHYNKKSIEKQSFTNLVSHITFNQDAPPDNTKISRSIVKNSLEFPCTYFIDRGFSEHILEKYDVGLCVRPEKEMYSRAVVPIYDADHKYLIGCSGRSIYEKCNLCKLYHDKTIECPKNNLYNFSKWKHSQNFKSQNCLYNFWFAKKYILDSSTVILVESPGNVWKLEESGIHNSVALFGANLSDRQKIILDGSGAMNIIIIMDNDDAGKRATNHIIDKCKNTYNIKSISITKPDIGDMTQVEIDEEIKRLIL
jgi:5S rRNA maturation endonuclease (ribonuclease M5)